MIPKDFNAYLQEQPGFHQEGDVFFQNDLLRPSDFEKDYFQLRQQEGRIYKDDALIHLPSVSTSHPLHNEWVTRKRSADRLILYLKAKKVNTLLEIGCGNGWLLHYIRQSFPLACCGIDIHEAELKQGARVFGTSDQITFLYANIFSAVFREPLAEIIILPGVIQYFPNLPALLEKLTSLLYPSGEIHILESPVYADSAVHSAVKRSALYFRNSGHPGMSQRYYHHSWAALDNGDYQLLYDPDTILNRLRKVITHDSPFPWIRITAK